LADNTVLSVIASEIPAVPQSGSFPEIDYTQLRAMIARGNLTLIDARYPADYAAGHLPEAISIPLDMSADRRSQLLDDVSRGDPVVIYCQSETCPYSAVIAHRLLNSGFYNVSIYREGWTGWKRQNSNPTTLPR
jgi:rhodanese-related sulfurtransferase